MPHSRGPSGASQAPIADKQSELPRLRKRLQKKFPSFRRPAPIDSSASNKLSTAVGLVAQQAGTVGQPSLRLSPDLSDAKWHEYLRAGQDSPDQHIVSVNVPNSPAVPDLIPEFSHLALSASKPRPSLESYLSSPASSVSTRSSMRRRAKTPVYTIGQLEGTSCARDSVAVDRSSVNLIAKQYQALIEPQDGTSFCIDGSHDSLPEPHSSYTRLSSARSQYSVGELATDLQPPPRNRRRISAQSPMSDNDTLVSFDEEAIYFKPLPFSPEPPSPPPRSRARVQRSAESSPSDHNLSLQICTDLLAKELSTAMVERSQGCGEDISSLQIWVMIEAYERLRDRVKEKGCLEEMESVFDNWLAALNSLHDRFTNDANSHHSHYESIGQESATMT